MLTIETNNPDIDVKELTRRVNEKARKIIGYNPKTEMKTGIKKTFDWIVENKEKIEASAKF